MHRRPPLRSFLLIVVALAGCSSAVKVQPFEGSDTPVCREVADSWPATVGGQPSRETAVQTRGVAAWGDPAIIARCGAPVPGPTTDQCLDVEGVDWVADQLEDGVAFTTYGRDPAIEVLVPDAFEPEPLVLPAFGAAAQVVPQGDRRCS
ncbi:hypothetical protein BH24ACT8_BH24ACT8_23560 [soil metagenome]|jgi:hypothetical protein